MYQNTKSSTVAGLLGIFLGAFGAHNWYLGEKRKGIIHVCMMSGAILIEIIAGVILPNALSFRALLTWASIFGVLTGIAGLAMFASSIWGLVEGITILAQGDAGLANKGYNVAPPAPASPQGYPAQGQYGYGPQPTQQPQYYGQPMNQPIGQPMGPMMNQPVDPNYMQQTKPAHSPSNKTASKRVSSTEDAEAINGQK